MMISADNSHLGCISQLLHRQHNDCDLPVNGTNLELDAVQALLNSSSICVVQH